MRPPTQIRYVRPNASDVESRGVCVYVCSNCVLIIGCAQFEETNGNMECPMVVDGSDDDDDGDDRPDDANDIFYYTDFNEYDQADNLRFLVSGVALLQTKLLAIV